MQRKWWIGGGAVAAALVVWVAARPKEKAPQWRTAKVERGPIRQRISATGTLSALVQVNVGTQVSGTIADLRVDYNSQVRKGQVIAQVDPTLLQAQVQDSAAGVDRARTALEDARRQYERAQRLSREKLLAEQDLDQKQVVFETAKANLATAEASLKRARTNLGYATITAPVSGVVVSRSVDVGQTVAASFNTPTLFVIAQDLTKMKLEASIDEADIGQVKTGQRGFFTVDSFPDTQFRGMVSQVRLEPVTQQNVVSYKVVMEVDNEDLQLRPGMTANVAIETHAKESVLLVPSAALRFNPRAFLPGIEIKAEPKADGKGDGKGAPGREGHKAPEGGRAMGEGRGEGRPMGEGRPGMGRMMGMGGGATKGMVQRRENQLWILDEKGQPKAIPVRAGITNGMFTEVIGEGLSEGMAILVGVDDKKAQAAASPSPLGGMPRR